jgi:hypothetical protein
MKKAIVMFVLTCSVANLFSQEIVKDKAYYLDRSKKQKSAAYGLLIGGAVCFGIGFLIGGGKETSLDNVETAAFLEGFGGLAMICSIPLFSAASKNKKIASLVASANTLPPVMLTRGGKKVISIGIAIPL